LWLSVCILALLIQQAQRMRRILLPYVACLAVTHFSTFFKKSQFSEKKIEKCFDFLYNFRPIHFSWQEKPKDVLKTVHMSVFIKSTRIVIGF
jgi:hypothetical protein